MQLPVATKNMLIVCSLVFLGGLSLPKVGIDMTGLLGLHYPGTRDFKPWQLVTYMFMHGSFSHLFFNMFALYMFGRVLEEVWGARRFLVYYFVTGIGAGCVQLLTWMRFADDPWLGYMVTIGASGAVFGILLAFGMKFPNAPLFILLIPIPVKAKYVVAGYGVIELVSGIAGVQGDGVAHFAHLGGMLFGWGLLRLRRLSF